MATGGARLRIIGLAVIGLVLVALSAFGLYLSPVSPHETITPLGQSIRFGGGVLWVAAMLIFYRRDPSRPMWKLILLGIAIGGTWALGYIPISLTWTLGEVLPAVGSAVTAHILLGFPTGQLRSRLDRLLVGFLYAFVLGSTLLRSLFRDPQWTDCGDYCPRNVLVVWPNNEVADALGTLALGAPILGVAVLLALWQHWRRSTPSGRRALVPILIAAPLIAAIESVWHVAAVIDRDDIRVVMTSLPQLFTLPGLILPAAVLLGVLRMRLARAGVADLAVDLGRGVRLGRLRETLARALRDPTLILAFPAPTGGGHVDGDGRPVELPGVGQTDRSVTRLDREGEELAVLIHDPAVDAEDPGLVDAVGSVARLALANERLSAEVRAQLEEVRASRARIVEAADAERRRIERDLHDGAQQRLVALALRLQTAGTAALGAQDLLEETTAELQAAVDEVRDLARGLHPPILTERGLGPALDALAERSTVPVRVSAGDERYPPRVEATAYFVAAEALTNVARHARATVAKVNVTADAERLIIAIADDGIGGADDARGSGLRGLTDRVAALGGQLTVTNPDEGGTVVSASLPLP